MDTRIEDVNRPDKQSGNWLSAFEALGTVFGLFAGLAVLFYVTGGAIVVGRLWRYGLPDIATVSEFPQTFLLTIALIWIALPTSLVAGLYAAICITFSVDFLSRSRRPGRLGYLRSVAIPIAGVGVVLTGIWWLRGQDWSWEFWVISVIVCMVPVLLAWHANTSTRSGSKSRAVALSTLVIATAAASLSFVAAASAPLPSARACGPDGTSEVALGWLLGQTADRIYLGGHSPTNGTYVVWVPSDGVKRMVIGEEKPASQLTC